MAIKFPRHDIADTRPLPDTRLSGSKRDDWSRDYPPFQTPGTQQATEVQRRLTGQWPGPDNDIPGIDVDASVVADNHPPEQQTEQSRRYEVYTAAARTAGDKRRHASQGQLAAGNAFVCEASFVPQFWRISVHSANAADLFWIDVDGVGVAAMEILGTNSIQTYPARGTRIAVVADSGNAGPASVSAAAFAALNAEGEK